MGRYALRRALLVPPLVLGGITLLFALFFLLPGDPVEVIAGQSGKNLPPAVKANIAARYGLDDPVPVQYVRYLANVARFDLGESYLNNRSVNETIGRTFKASARLAFWAILIEVGFGVVFGVASARRKDKPFDRLVLIITVVVGAIPVFVGGYLVVQALGVVPFQHGWPKWTRFQTGIGPDSWFLGVVPTGSQWRHLVLPAFVLAGLTTAGNIRILRSSMLEAAGADYLRTARMKGLSARRIAYRHALPNALIPFVTVLGIDFGVLLGGAILTETVFNWPGLGSTAARAIETRDAPLVLGVSLVALLVYQVLSFLVDVAYGLIDPRIRVGARAG